MLERNVSNSFVSYFGLAGAECDLFRTFLRESWEEPFKGYLPNLVVDFSSSFLLQYCDAMHPEDVVDAPDAKAFAEKRKFFLKILTQLDTFVHCSNEHQPGPRAVLRRCLKGSQQLQAWCFQPPL